MQAKNGQVSVYFLLFNRKLLVDHSAEFWTKFHMEIPLLLEITIFP